jgi:rare lipoprotein A
MKSKRLLCSSSHAPSTRPLVSFAPCAARAVIIAALTGGAAISLGGCAQQPPLQRVAHSKEYFPSSKYGPASPRVVADGEPVPRGGGIYMVGKPYSVAGQTYYPSEKHIVQVGWASWYGDAFHGRRTANSEVYDRDSISAAHPTMPLPSYARVTNLSNHYSMIVRVNDRGPFEGSRIMDVSRRTAEALDFRSTGTTRVKVEYIGAASLAGSDDAKLLATLRFDRPATLDGLGQTKVADLGMEPIRTASLAPVGAQEPKAQDQSSRVFTDNGQTGAAQAPLPPRIARQHADDAPLPPARPLALGGGSSQVRFAARSKQAD